MFSGMILKITNNLGGLTKLSKGNGYISDLKKEFKGYNSKKLSQDVMAGLTVAAVALPLALAFAVSSGAPAAAGLITAILGGILMSSFSGGYYQISGPTGTMAGVLLVLVAEYGMQGIFITGLLAGIFLVIAGVLHLGNLTSYIPMPVVTGFTSGIAIMIALGQIDNLFGVTSVGNSLVEKILSYGHLGFSPDYLTLGIGIAVTAFIVVFPKKIGAIIPPSLLGLILATAASIHFGWDVATVGEIPQTLLPDARLKLSEIPWREMNHFIAPAMSIAMLSMIESLLCGASAGHMVGVKLKNDTELISKGVGNIVVPFFGGIPATAALARTSMAIKSGCQTRITGVVHGIGLLIAMLVLAPVMSKIPLSALSGVLLVTTYNMNDWDSIKSFFDGKFKGAISKYFVTMLATIIFDLTIAIAAGVVLSLCLLVAKLSKLEIAYDPVNMERLGEENQELMVRYSKTMVVYISGAMIFSNTDSLDEIPPHLEGYDTLLFSLRGVSELDISSGQALYETVETMQKQGVDIMFCGVNEKVHVMMQRTKITDLVGEDSFYWSAVHALGQLHPRNDMLHEEE